MGKILIRVVLQNWQIFFWKKNAKRNNLLMLDARFICLLHKE